MSGTSLDGLDVVAAQFWQEHEQWHFDILAGQTIDYELHMLEKLRYAHTLNAFNLAVLDVNMGKWYGQQVALFITQHRLKPLFVASHGHTIFHDPALQLTLQIGNPAAIVALTQCPVVADFRRLDIALGGQGAPLVPIGDALLFNEYQFCLNLGGVANISMPMQQPLHAGDICICNMALNFLAQEKGFAYDNNGRLAANGEVQDQLLKQLNTHQFFNTTFPKSTGREFFETFYLPILQTDRYSTNDKLATVCEHIAIQIAMHINQNNTNHKAVLVTGGGALNQHLTQRLQTHSQVHIHLATAQLTHFKEALIFAFLGLLRWQNSTNTLQSVTGASRNSVGGCIYSAS